MTKHALFVGLLLAALPGAAADKPPSWLAEMATREVPKYESTVDYVVLFDEESVTVDPSGVVVTRERKAVKILTRSGRRAASAAVLYRRDTGKVRSLDAWLIYSSGKHKTYGKKETADTALASNDVYNESRLRVINGSADADPGAVFGYESVSEDRSVFTQFLFQFQGAAPSLTARFSVELPAGWEAEAKVFNHEPIEPLVQGNRRTWELRNLEPIKDEPARPDNDAIAPRLAVSYFPPPDAAGLGPAFRDWPTVSTWLNGLNETQYKPDDTVAAKARELTAGASTDLDKIAALARYAQDVKYVSIQTGVGRGGGYKPHAATDVLANNYGDCKDKANLLRSMLDAMGVKAYPVAIYSSDRSFVREEWASPQQFNHAILAISVPADTDLPAAKDYDGFGRLLFFDPTDPHTPFGQMPEDEQDAWALLVAPENGGLVRTPSTSPAGQSARAHGRGDARRRRDDPGELAGGVLRRFRFGEPRAAQGAGAAGVPQGHRALGLTRSERGGGLEARGRRQRQGLYARCRVPGAGLRAEHGRTAACVQAGRGGAAQFGGARRGGAAVPGGSGRKLLSRDGAGGDAGGLPSGREAGGHRSRHGVWAIHSELASRGRDADLLAVDGDAPERDSGGAVLDGAGLLQGGDARGADAGGAGEGVGRATVRLPRIAGR